MRQHQASPRVFAAALALAIVFALAIVPGRTSAQTAGPETLGFKKHFTVEITNPSKLTLEDQAVILEVNDIRATVAPDFNTYMYALFEVKGGDYNLVVSQADDLDKDRYHDEIVLVRTLAAASTTRLVCYYTPNKSFQLMPTAKAFARGSWETGGPEAGWESNLVAYEFSRGAIGVLGKLRPGLVMRGFPAGLTKTDWGLNVLDPGESAGAGGLSLWDRPTRLPLFGPGAPQAKVTVISPGPVRGLVKAEYPAVKTAAGDVSVTVYLSAFADNIYSRQDVVVTSKASSPIALGPGLERLPSAEWSFDKAKGTLAAFGKGAGKAGEIGLAAIFPPSDLLDLDDSPLERTVKLGARPGRKLTYWVAAAWEKGATAADASSAKAWTAHVDDLAARLLVPVKVEFKAP